MGNQKIDQVCLKRLKSKDFAQERDEYMPTSSLEKSLILLLVIFTVVLLAVNVYRAYFE